MVYYKCKSKDSKMSNYARYKKWRILTDQAKDFVPLLHYEDGPETAFKQHIEDMGLYKLMETLEDWHEPVDEPVYPIPFVPPTPPYKYTPTLPQDVKPQCSKCGISLSGVMGYVCNDAKCPTFMKVTC